jgi:hypothetical protein
VRCTTFPTLLLAGLTGCASVSHPKLPLATRIEVLTPVDRVPLNSSEVFLPAAGATLEERRQTTLRVLREDLVTAIEANGAEACGADGLATTGPRPAPAELAARGRQDGADVVISTELIAYGQVRRSWLWLLAAQGLLAGVGHGVVVREATGSQSLGWWAGAGEFALETLTWVGGALFASHIIDPVIIRVTAVRARDGAVIGSWTREGLRPFREWLTRRGAPPRCERLRTVSHRIFAKLVPKLLGKVAAWERQRRALPSGLHDRPGHPVAAGVGAI